jgi:hypothetical protein
VGGETIFLIVVSGLFTWLWVMLFTCLRYLRSCVIYMFALSARVRYLRDCFICVVVLFAIMVIITVVITI